MLSRTRQVSDESPTRLCVTSDKDVLNYYDTDHHHLKSITCLLQHLKEIIGDQLAVCSVTPSIHPFL